MKELKIFTNFDHFVLKDINDKYFKKSWELYENSFPKNERRTLKEQEKIFKNDKYQAFVVLKNGELLAILFFWNFKKYTFIEHFAVSDKLRGRSFGSKILKDFLTKYDNVVLEIELLKDEICKKRLNFYEKLGFMMNAHKHFQVPFRENSHNLELLFLSYKKRLTKEQYEFLYSQMRSSLTVR
jgi:GNAT superfamily N-acetyltransferase